MKTKPITDLQEGDTFLYENELFLKTKTINDNEVKYNAVCFKTGEFRFFENEQIQQVIYRLELVYF